MYLILEYVALVVLILTLGILLFGFCVVLLLIGWGFQTVCKPALRHQKSAPTAHPGPGAHFRYHTFQRRRFADEASPAAVNGPGATPEPAPHLLH
jgi:hypothetical protein